MIWTIIVFNIFTGQQVELAVFPDEVQCRAALPAYRQHYDYPKLMVWCKERKPPMKGE
jgi:hypothetical protein